MGNINNQIKEFLSPINTIEEATFMLCLKLCFNQNHSYVTSLTNTAFGTVYNEETIKCALSKYLFLMNDLATKIETAKESIRNFKTNVEGVSQCFKCLNSVGVKEKKSILTYSYNGVSLINYDIRSCLICSIEYFPDYYLNKNEKYFYCFNINTDLKYMQTSKETSFHINLLKWYDINLVRNTTSLSGFSEAFNDFIISSKGSYISNNVNLF